MNLFYSKNVWWEPIPFSLKKFKEKKSNWIITSQSQTVKYNRGFKWGLFWLCRTKQCNDYKQVFGGLQSFHMTPIFFFQTFFFHFPSLSQLPLLVFAYGVFLSSHKILAYQTKPFVVPFNFLLCLVKILKPTRICLCPLKWAYLFLIFLPLNFAFVDQCWRTSWVWLNFFFIALVVLVGCCLCLVSDRVKENSAFKNLG